MADVWTTLTARTRSDGGAPLVTSIDGSSRVELSAVTLANAAAKIANALRGELGLEPGDAVRVDLPLHWQLAAWQAGIWTAGLCIAESGPVALHVSDGRQAPADGSTSIAVSLHPFGLPIEAALPRGVEDATLLVRQQPDAYLFEPPASDLVGWRSAEGDVTQGRLLESAREMGQSWGCSPGARLLVVEDAPHQRMSVLLAPLATGSAAVLLRGVADLEGVRMQERITAEVV